MKTIGLILLVAGCLSGCGTAPQAPLMSWNDYLIGAQINHRIDICVDAQLLALETAAAGKRIVEAKLATYRVVEQKYLAAAANEAKNAGDVANRSNCDQLAISILQNTKNNPPTQRNPAGAYKPQYTSCSTYFGQTYCTTY